jgi:hypothetical protein
MQKNQDARVTWWGWKVVDFWWAFKVNYLSRNSNNFAMFLTKELWKNRWNHRWQVYSECSKCRNALFHNGVVESRVLEST